MNKYASVTDVVRRIKDDLQKDYRLRSVAMEGNIIGLKRASNGHYYMNICDDECSLRAVLFRSRAGRSMETVREGDHVVVIGTVNVYEKGGTVSFLIERLFSQGVGTLQAEYERIRKELADGGYFAAEHKKTLPRFPWRVGVLTSPTGAVLHDIRKIAAERNPYIELVVFPIPVQGQGAAEKVAAAVTAAGKNRTLDLLILARGGGSLEDLWCFNSSEVVKAIYQSEVPLISAVGHETDTTLADYAADVRAATPTHAAEMAFPDVAAMELDLAALADRSYRLLQRQIETRQRSLAQQTARLQPKRYNEQLQMKEAAVRHLLQTAEQYFRLKLVKLSGDLGRLQASLQALDPTGLLRKGYGQLEQSGKRISSVQQVAAQEPLLIRLADGVIRTEVKEVIIHGENN